MHATSLIRIKPTAYGKYSPLQLVFGKLPNIFPLRTFVYDVFVPITLPQHSKLGPQHRLEIYDYFDYPSIIKYIELLTENIFKAYFEDCHFDEIVFASSEGVMLSEAQKKNMNTLTLSM